MIQAGLRASRLERLRARPMRYHQQVAQLERAAVASERRAEDAVRRGEDLQRQVVGLRESLDAATETIAHLRRVEARLAPSGAVTDAIPAASPEPVDAATARAGARAFILEMQHLLFETREPTGPAESAAILVAGNASPRAAVETLVNLSEDLHGARSFQHLVPLLGTPAPYPLAWDAADPPLRIVDVGSQELATEADMYAPLQAIAPITVVGFDPFLELEPGAAPPREVRRPDGRIINTYADLVGDGTLTRFRVNRHSPTSSTLATNHEVTRGFGLLDLALETVSERLLPSRRLDDVLADAVPIDLLKIDVQGATHTVLASASGALSRTLVCHVEAELAEVYAEERLFGDVDVLLRAAGFDFVDFFSLGRQRYACFDPSPRRAFHRGRTLWCDAVYVRGLDRPAGLGAGQLRRTALILHGCYNKQDVAAELLRRADTLDGGRTLDAYLQAQVGP